MTRNLIEGIVSLFKDCRRNGKWSKLRGRRMGVQVADQIKNSQKLAPAP